MSTKASLSQRPRHDVFSGLTIGRISGIEIGIAWSLAVIFLLIFFSLALNWFPRWHEDWSALTVWGSAFVAATLFLCSVLLHELSHALVARRNGVKVRRITLFMFGGLAHMESDAPSAGAEFKIAVVGPFVSLGIAALSWAVAVALVPQLGGPATDHPAEILSQLGPVPSVLIWLGMVNLILGLFNLIPGFPLDGGRVLRAGLWRVTGDREKATRWASYAGRAVAALLVANGILMIFDGGHLGGIWWILIGWFLYGAAKASYQQVLVRESLQDVAVREIMRVSPLTVPDDMPLSTLVQDHIMASDQRSFPVLHENQLVGMVSIEDVRKVSRDTWDKVTIREVMTPAERLAIVRPDDEAADALQQIATRDIREIPVVENGHLAGVIRREDLMKWISLYQPQHS